MDDEKEMVLELEDDDVAGAGVRSSCSTDDPSRSSFVVLHAVKSTRQETKITNMDCRLFIGIPEGVDRSRRR